MFRVTRYPMISKTESGRVGYREKYRVAGRVRVPAGHWWGKISQKHTFSFGHRPNYPSHTPAHYLGNFFTFQKKCQNQFGQRVEDPDFGKGVLKWGDERGKLERWSMSVSEGWYHFAILVTRSHSQYVPGTYMLLFDNSRAFFLGSFGYRKMRFN